MKILYVAMRYDYGLPSRGESFEHYNFYEPLRDMGHDILYFDFMTLLEEHGRRAMNRRLLDVCRSEKPDVLFSCLFKDELEKETLRDISAHSDTVTVNWFADDHWRFENFSRHWAPCFNHVVTTASSALPKYAEIGYRGVIKSQWGCNNARAWGTGWQAGRLSQDEMVGVFSASRIVLNLSNASVLNTGPFGRAKVRVRASLESRMGRWLNRKPDGSLRKVRSSYHEQIKGRNFEVPGCGAFLLTGEADNLGDYYEEGREVVTFSDVDDMIDKIRYYLRHEEERETVAEAGFRRTLSEHTDFHRFSDIFRQMGMNASVASIGARRGETVNIE